MSEVPHSEKDFEIASRVFEWAIEYFQIPDEPTPEQAKDLIREDGTVDWAKAPLVCVKRFDGGHKFLSLVYSYNGIPIVFAEYSPTVAILEFQEEARRLIKNWFPDWSEDKVDQSAENEMRAMTFHLFSRLYPRMNLAMQNLTSEAISIWFRDRLKWEAQILSESGVKPNHISDTKLLKDLLKDYQEDVIKLWLDVPNRTLEQKKIQLNKEYPAILNHWQKLREWYRKNDLNWREYAKAGIFADTPDDLLRKLEDSSFEKTSHLAIEHTARRVGLLKLTQDEKVLEKRAQHIKMTGYTPRQLFEFLSEGKKLLGEMHNSEPLHPETDSDEP